MRDDNDKLFSALMPEDVCRQILDHHAKSEKAATLREHLQKIPEEGVDLCPSCGSEHVVIISRETKKFPKSPGSVNYYRFCLECSSKY